MNANILDFKIANRNVKEIAPTNTSSNKITQPQSSSTETYLKVLDGILPMYSSSPSMEPSFNQDRLH